MKVIYKILLPTEWAALNQNGSTKGSPLDQRDGFIHFSTAGQVIETVGKHFQQAGSLILAEIDARKLSMPLKWESTRNGQLFPHLYADLQRSAVTRHWLIEKPSHRGHSFPPIHGLTEPNWSAWTPTESASLCFVVRDGEILLIHKKRGLGAGKINGPGGRMEPNESLKDCARRETEEEIGGTPQALNLAGELYFEFIDGYRLYCAVFRADDIAGTLVETAEAKPFWCKIEDIPYDNMWTDDRHWMPWLLERRRFIGRFHFEGDRMLSGKVHPAQ